MNKMAAAFALAALILAPACDEAPPPQPAAKANTCELSLDNLVGEWVKTVPTPEGDVVDERNRVKFFVENGTPKLLATLGTIDKRTFVQSEKRSRDAIYLQERDPETIAKVKAENKDPNYRLQGKIYVRVNEKRCQIQLSEAYITYVNGELVEPGNGMAVNYIQTGKTYSWENCTEPRGLVFSEEPVDPSKLKAPTPRDKPLLRPIPANKKGYFAVYYPDSSFTDGCATSFEVYDEDVKIDQDPSTLVAGNGGKVLMFDRTFQPYNTGRYIEVFRYDACGGEKKLSSVSCGVVKPE